jgi:hypothetical protein
MPKDAKIGFWKRKNTFWGPGSTDRRSGIEKKGQGIKQKISKE